jgi:hypothetical protein
LQVVAVEVLEAVEVAVLEVYALLLQRQVEVVLLNLLYL